MNHLSLATQSDLNSSIQCGIMNDLTDTYSRKLIDTFSKPHIRNIWMRGLDPDNQLEVVKGAAAMSETPLSIVDLLNVYPMDIKELLYTRAVNGIVVFSNYDKAHEYLQGIITSITALRLFRMYNYEVGVHISMDTKLVFITDNSFRFQSSMYFKLTVFKMFKGIKYAQDNQR